MQGNVTANVLEHWADFAQSKAKGALLTLEELPKFLSSSLKELENTASYKQSGLVWFYLKTTGSQRTDGILSTYKFNREKRTLKEMFTEVSEIEYINLPLSERARFWSGSQHLQVALGRLDVSDVRLDIYGNGWLGNVAPVVVVKQQDQVSTKRLHGLGLASRIALSLLRNHIPKEKSPFDIPRQVDE